MKNTFWKRERIEIMIALALFNYVFLEQNIYLTI